MTREWGKTAGLMAAAAVLAWVAVATTPRYRGPGLFQEEGQPFFPSFTDPTAVASLEIIEYDEDTASAKPFKVELQEGRWTIPSHYGYPADVKERVAKTAALLVDLKKGAIRSDRTQDHEKLGVLDPIDAAVTTFKGRGKRLTCKGKSGEVLADLIIGKKLPESGRNGQHAVRLPGQKRIYAVELKEDPPGTKFEDWVETDLLQVSFGDLSRVVINNYRVDEQTGRVATTETLVFKKPAGESTWMFEDMKAGEELHEDAFSALRHTLADLAVVGVRPKPARLAEQLRKGEGLRLGLDTMLSLREKGFFVSGDGRLLSNEGELVATTKEGVVYVLRFGEVLFGGEETDKKGKPKKASEHRYLFLTASHDPAAVTDDDLKKRMDEFAKKTKGLSERFAGWFYVISDASFRTLRAARAELVKPAAPPPPPPSPPPPTAP